MQKKAHVNESVKIVLWSLVTIIPNEHFKTFLLAMFYFNQRLNQRGVEGCNISHGIAIMVL